MTVSAAITCAVALSILLGASYVSRFFWATTILPLAFLVAASFHRGGTSIGIALLLGCGLVWAAVGYLSLSRHDRNSQQRAAEHERVETNRRNAEQREAEARSAEWMAEYIANETARMQREEAEAKRCVEAEERDRIDREAAVSEHQRLDAIRALMAPRSNDCSARPSPTARLSPPSPRPSWDLDALLDGIPEPHPTRDSGRLCDG